MAEEKKRLTEVEARRIRADGQVTVATAVELERYREVEWFQELLAFKRRT